MFFLTAHGPFPSMVSFLFLNIFYHPTTVAHAKTDHAATILPLQRFMLDDPVYLIRNSVF
jgi:hypothetical protein